MSWVWLKHGEEQPFLVALVENKLNLTALSERLELKRSSLRAGDFALDSDASGRSVDIKTIEACASMANGGDGSKGNPFIIIGSKPASREWDEKLVMESLIKRYGAAAEHSRSIGTRSVEIDLGQDSKVVGREDAYQLLLQGAGLMYNGFLSPGDDLGGYKLDKVLSFGFVAFPGAGKTTLGTKAWDFLKHHWSAMDTNAKWALLKPVLNMSDFTSFVDMCDTSLGCDLCMYHPVAHEDGGLLQRERELHPLNVLALRCLAAVLDDRKYRDFLDGLDEAFPGLKGHLTLELVLKFLRKVLKVADGTKLLVPFFFDEVNAITKNWQGEEVVFDSFHDKGKATWFQSVMSAYIEAQWTLAHKFQEVGVFPVLSIASTAFYAGDLRFTESSQALTLAVPLLPLTESMVEDVVLTLLNQWAERLSLDCGTRVRVPEKLTSSTRYLIQMSGGMPRALSRGLESTVVVFKRGVESIKEVFEMLTTELDAYTMREIVDRWRGKMNYNQYLSHPAKQALLLRVLVRSITATPVLRFDVVVENPARGSIKYWNLEAAGLVSLAPLSPVRGRQRQLGAAAASTSSSATTPLDYYTRKDPDVVVKCSPFVIYSVVESGLLGVDVPNFINDDWRQEEKDDLCTILLRIYLLKESLGQTEFEVQEILPPGTIVPNHLQGRRFRLHSRCRGVCKVHQFRRKVTYSQMLAAAPDSAAFFLVGNDGADSVLLLEEVGGVPEFPLAIQSKQTKKEQGGAFTPLMDNFYRNVKSLGVTFSVSWKHLKKVASNLNEGKTRTLEVELTMPRDFKDFAFVYCSNQVPSAIFRKNLRTATISEPVFAHIMVAFEEVAREYTDVFSIISMVRSRKRTYG